MATPQTHPLIFFMNFKLSSALVFMLIISLSLMNYCNALGGRKILQKEYVTFDVNSFLSTSCKASVQGGNNRGAIASLKVTHRHGPCSKSGLNDSNNNRPSLADVLTRDQIRVASIQNNRHGFNKSALGDSKATITAKPDTNVGFSNYVVSVGLGTPTKYLTLVFDTGSSLTWTQCQPCTGHCYPQKDSIFDPSASTSYTNSSCDSTECSQLSNTGLQQECSPESTCLYHIGYGDGSFTNGNLGNELLTLTPNDVFDDFTFGCGEDNDGLFGDTAGILGLGRDSFSVVSQTAEKYGNYFSYCLPTESGSDGHLTFGNDNGASGINLAFTPFADNSPQGSSFYFVNIVSISVGGTQLTISPSEFQSGGGFIIDSGTIITRLPPTAYAALRDAFKQQMSAYTSAPGDSFLDTCYDFSNDSSPQEIPSISFTFDGNVKVDLGSEEVLINKDQSIFCLAFAANNEDTDIGIFGNLQQQTFEVAYDVAGGRLGFGPNGCS